MDTSRAGRYSAAVAGAQGKHSGRIVSLLLGLAATLAVLGAHLAGWDRRPELQTLDWRMRLASSAEPSDRVVHVDIDDGSLKSIGRWPWPREFIAGMIDILDECGARTVALDIIFPDPQKIRYVSAAAEIYGADPAHIIGDDKPMAVFDDAILAAAMVRAGQVAMPMHLDWQHTADESVDDAVGQILSAASDASLQEVLDRMPGSFGRGAVEKAYLRQRGLQAMQRFGFKTDDPAVARTGRMTPPLVTLAQAIDVSGFVTVIPDEDGVVRRIPLLGRCGDRTYPQFALALAAHDLARDGGGKPSITASTDMVNIHGGENLLREVPLAEGTMLINFVPKRKAGRVLHLSAGRIVNIWHKKAELARLQELALALRREVLTLGRKLPNEQLDRLYWKVGIELQQQFDKLHAQRVAAERRIRRDLLYRPAETPNLRGLAVLRKHEQTTRTEQRRLAAKLVQELRKPEHLDVFLGKPGPPSTGSGQAGAATQPKDDTARTQPEFKAAKARAMGLLKRLDQLPGERKDVEKALAEMTAALQPKVAGKICLIGSTATAAADFVPTPVGPRVPGVVVHAAIVDTILTGRFIGVAPGWLTVVVILLAGLVVSLPAATRSVVQAGPIAALMALGYAVFNTWTVLGLWHVHLALVAPIAGMVSAFLLVTAYRQLVEERAKRHIRGMFAHALSPVLVDRLLDDPEVLKPGKRRISCMFTDLAGFTDLSEQLGPADTVALLNRYFDRVADVVQNRSGGYLNKFLGDGLLVFFGAPVFQDDHAARAVAAAVEYQQELARFDQTLAGELGRPVGLTVRIGISTGEAMVGDCGSTDRMDYTAIGDCVNLASRLEAANKFFGTGILIDPPTHDGCGDDLLRRSLGRITVQGVAEPLEAWHVLGRRDEVPQPVRDAAGAFAEAMEFLGDRNFDRAKDLFEKALAAMPDDRPARLYLDACDQYLAEPPEKDWPGHVFNVTK